MSLTIEGFGAIKEVKENVQPNKDIRITLEGIDENDALESKQKQSEGNQSKVTGLRIDTSSLNPTSIELKDKTIQSRRSQTQSNRTSRALRYGRKKKRTAKKKKQPFISFDERTKIANEALDLE